MTEEAIEWVDELPERGRPGPKGRVWVERLAPLMDRPGEWAIVRRDTGARCRSTARYLSVGVLKIPEGRWEFVARQVDKSGAVYARYLGPEEVSR